MATPIQEITLPLNLGTVNSLEYFMGVNNNTDAVSIAYMLSSDTNKRTVKNTLKLPIADFEAHGNDKEWILNWVASQIGVTII